MGQLTFKRVEKEHETQLFILEDEVLNHLEKKDFFIPYSDEDRKKLFDEDFGYHYGAFDNDRLIAINSIFFNKKLLDNCYHILNIDKSKKMCEIGGFMVSKSYEGKGIMKQLSDMQYKLAQKLDFDYVIATAHPDNTASNIILQKIGLLLSDKTMTSNGYPRNLYYKALK